jgi:quercetin dioxygenase-like cupin family protein
MPATPLRRVLGTFVLTLAFTAASAQMNMMGSDMMGENAEITVLAEQQIEMLPENPLAWIGFDLSGIDGEIDVMSPAPGFLYANQGTHAVTVDGEAQTLQVGEALFVAQDARVSLQRGEGLWHIVLADPEADAPAELEGADVVFSSGELEGIPDAPVELRFLLVALPMGGMTSAHTHPGPEFIYVTRGDIEYETGLNDTEMLHVGDHRALPAGTAVQKRNPVGAMAAFLSWFFVDPDRPFASEESFD